VIYLVVAYAFAIVLLGGYLVWSLRKLRELEGPANSEPAAVSSRGPR
jgi:CcmD family protein